MARKAWRSVAPAGITNCFAKGGFLQLEVNESIQEEQAIGERQC